MIRFDTRDKKPKVYSIILLTILTVAVTLPLYLNNHDGNLKWINAILTLYFAGVVLILFDAFRKQLEYNPYSYNTIIYSGFGLFLFMQVLTRAYLTVRCFLEPAGFGTDEMLYTLLNSGKNFLRLSIPALIIFSVGLFISNLKLIRIYGMKFANCLAMMLAVLIVTGLFLIFLLNRYVVLSNSKSLVLNLLLNLAVSVYLYFESMMTGVIIADVIASKYQADPDKDFLIIPGAGLEKDGTPSPILRNRIELARNFYKAQMEKTGKSAKTENPEAYENQRFRESKWRDSIPFAQWSPETLGAGFVLPFALTNSGRFRLRRTAHRAGTSLVCRGRRGFFPHHSG